MKKLIWVAVFALLLLSISVFLYRFNNMSRREHHIFCEVITFGMSSDDVLSSLREFGDISYSTPLPNGDGYGEIAIRYIDSQVVGGNTYILSFQDGRYTSASVTTSFWGGNGLGGVNSVCGP